ASRCSSSSSERSRRSLARKEITTFALHELRLHRQLLRGKPERLLGERLRDPRQLEHDAARLDHCDPPLGRALALAHARLRRLLRVRLVGEDVDPDLAAALDLAGHRDAGRLDLAVRDPAVLERLDPVLAEVHGRLAGRLAAPVAAVVLPELRLLRKQHRLALPLVARLLELRRILDLLLAGRRLGCVGHRSRGRLDLRLDHRLLAALGRHAFRVGARLLDLLGTRLPRPAAAGAAAGPRRARPVARARAAGAVPLAGAPAAHRPEALAVLAAVPAGFARGAEAFGDAPAPPC